MSRPWESTRLAPTKTRRRHENGFHESPPAVSVVLASIDARSTIAASLSRFLDEAGSQGELILVDASRDGTAEEAERSFPRVQVLRRPAGWLAPELWRDGLAAAKAPLVAFSTAQMVPSAGWLAALRGRLETAHAAVVGGPIEPSPRLSANDRALYLLRYVNYLRPLPERGPIEPPGDNALYRRSALAGLEAAWDDGFWEVEIHRRLRARGERLVMASEAAVEFRGGGRLAAAIRQRRSHARHYGATRAGQMGNLQRLARSAAAPAVPAVLLHRIAATLAARGRRLGPWLPALPSLSLLLAAWSVGEATGTWFGPPPQPFLSLRESEAPAKPA
jgi:hypothetical protein